MIGWWIMIPDDQVDGVLRISQGGLTNRLRSDDIHDHQEIGKPNKCWRNSLLTEPCLDFGLE